MGMMGEEEGDDEDVDEGPVVLDDNCLVSVDGVEPRARANGLQIM